MTKISPGAFAEIDLLSKCLKDTNYHPKVQEFVNRLIWDHPHALGTQVADLFEEVAKNLTIAFSPEPPDFEHIFSFNKPQPYSLLQSQLIANLFKLCKETGRFDRQSLNVSATTHLCLDPFRLGPASRL